MVPDPIENLRVLSETNLLLPLPGPFDLELDFVFKVPHERCCICMFSSVWNYFTSDHAVSSLAKKASVRVL